MLKSRFGIRKTRASDKESGILLRDGAEIAVPDKENGSVIQEIRKNPVLRYRKWCTGVTGQEKTDHKHLLLQMCLFHFWILSMADMKICD